MPFGVTIVNLEDKAKIVFAEEVYWKSVFPNNPMPKALKDILPPPGFPEFLNLLVARGMKDIGLGEGLAEAFREFDKDHNSFVSAAEFRRIPAESLQMPKLMRWSVKSI
ncbi:hypothetical protein V6N13_077877 [Hibiscus sabdariffa]